MMKCGVLSLLYVAVFLAVVNGGRVNSDGGFDSDGPVARTFGHNALKRLSFIFLPVMFTLGVISTLLMALAVISVKNLAIGVILLIVTVSQAVSRVFTAPAASPLVFHPRAELLPAPVAPWPPAPAPVYQQWARSDDVPITD